MSRDSNTLKNSRGCIHLHPCRKGYTLTEVAIVLGILGLLIGGIWSTVTYVREQLRINQALRDITVLGQALELMGTTLDTTYAYDFIGNGELYTGVMNNVLIKSGVVPQDMIDSTGSAIIHPWATSMNGQPNAVLIESGTYSANEQDSIPAGITGVAYPPADIPPAGSPVNTFEIALLGIPVDACIRLAVALTGTNRDKNLISVFLNQWHPSAAFQTFPISLSTATAACANSSDDFAGSAMNNAPGNLLDGTSSIDVVYKYR